jgi:hypothetical protein
LAAVFARPFCRAGASDRSKKKKKKKKKKTEEKQMFLFSST